jgi:hypothetical protein
MKKIYMVLAALCLTVSGFAQSDTTKVTTDTVRNTTDTIKVGNFIIIRKKRNNNDENAPNDVTIERKPEKPGKIKTNWFIFDLGFANTNDKTNYTNLNTIDYLRSPLTKDDFKLRTIKSSNVNIWLVMQKINLLKGYINLKYGLGLEMFNLRYESSINYGKDSRPYIFMDTISFTKNKLYAGYATVPFMLNFNTTPGKKKGLSLSAGISAGYLIGSHDKQISGERGKDKTHGNIGLEQFRLAYIGELGIGSIRLFGSYAITKLHEKTLEQYPYSFGIRFSSF